MQKIDDVVDNLAANVEELATELRQKIAYLDERHHLLKQLEELEPNSRQSIKELRERVALLQAIARSRRDRPVFPGHRLLAQRTEFGNPFAGAGLLRPRSGARSRQCRSATRRGLDGRHARHSVHGRRPGATPGRSRNGRDQNLVVGAQSRIRPLGIGLRANLHEPGDPRHCRSRTSAGTRPQPCICARVHWGRQDFCRTRRGDRGPCPGRAPAFSTR